jgi:uncharacterized protein (TIGR02466 family)
MDGLIHTLFPKIVYTKDLSDRISVDDSAELKRIADDQSWINAGNSEIPDRNDNNISETSSNNDILNTKELLFFKKILIDEFNIFKNNVFKYTYNDFKLTTSWITKSNPGKQSNYHNHNNCMYSGVFYINTDNTSGDISFHDYSVKRFELNVEEYNFNNASEIKFNPYNNLLILFPSELHHKILINKSDTIRYSLAFNLVPTGLLGNKNSDSQWIV